MVTVCGAHVLVVDTEEEEVCDQRGVLLEGLHGRKHWSSTLESLSYLFTYLRLGLMYSRLASHLPWSRGCPWSFGPQAPISWVLGSQACTIRPTDTGDQTQAMLGKHPSCVPTRVPLNKTSRKESAFFRWEWNL